MGPARAYKTALVLVGATTLCSDTVKAQVPPIFGPGRQAVSLVVGAVAFQYDGTGIAELGSEGLPVFDYSGAVYGLRYSNLAVRAQLTAGVQPAEGDGAGVRLIDAWLTSAGIQSLAHVQSGNTHLRIPIVLAATFRHASIRGEPLPVNFGASSVGIGVGATLSGQAGKHLQWRLDVHPAAGMATSSQTDAVGIGYLADAEAGVNLANVKGRFGVQAGYALRYQVWNNRGSRRFAQIPDELYDYRGITHAVSAGLTF